MATQESTNGRTGAGNFRETDPARDVSNEANRDRGEREDWISEEDRNEDDEDEAEFEEILLPESIRESFSELADALRNVVRAHPLAILAGAAGAAYICGHRAARR